MFRPSIALSFLTALFTADASRAAPSYAELNHETRHQEVSVTSDEIDENNAIVADARRSLINEFQKL